ncbi:MAG: TfoX/Sxy family protein [Chloroflexota bacterium]
MAWEKSPPDLVDAFDRVLARFPEVQRRKMFGYPAAFVGGNMVTGLHQQNWVVRLSTEDIERARDEGATSFEPMAGRPMKGFVALPAAARDDPDAAASWVERAIEFGRTLPAK